MGHNGLDQQYRNSNARGTETEMTRAPRSIAGDQGYVADGGALKLLVVAQRKRRDRADAAASPGP